MAFTTTPPLYVLPQQKGRAIIPKTVILLLLGTIFYLGVLLNISLLELTVGTETTTNLIALLIIIGLVGVGIINGIRKGKYDYLFYQNRIQWNQKTVLYQSINDIQRKEKWSDKIFKTYSLQLNDQFTIKHISQEVNIKEYIEKMRVYASGQTGVMSERV